MGGPAMKRSIDSLAGARVGPDMSTTTRSSRLLRGILAALFAIASLAYADSSAPTEGTPLPDPSGGQPRRAVALAEILGNNILVNAFDRSVLPGAWADTDFQTSWANLRGPWVFDQDPFPVNEIGHPIQGSLYFVAGRANGLGFWESAAGTAFGSLTWKLFGEVDDPNINDLITTTLGGTALGEMEHRLYVEAKRQGSEGRFFASPLDAANDALFGGDEDGARGRVSLSLEAGVVAPYLDPDPSRRLAPGFGDIAGEFGDTIVYGDPFGARSAPFDYFEQRFNAALSPSFYGLSFFSNGTLLSLPIADTGRSELSVAASLHYDYVYSSLIELAANSAGLSLIGELRDPSGGLFKGELHVNALALGANENEYYREYIGAQGINQEGRDYDFCFGGEAKVYLSASLPRLGTLSLEGTCYDFRPIPGIAVSSSPPAPLDYSIVGILNLAYEHPVAARLSLGAAYTLYFKDALYSDLPSVAESAQSVALYAKLTP
jgi:hypothetical protein